MKILWIAYVKNKYKGLISDDTYIAGYTKNECARALKECGAEEIRGLVVGRSVDKTHLEHIKKLNESYDQWTAIFSIYKW